MSSSTSTTINQLESNVQKRLHIKWVDAKRLIHDALRNCEISTGTSSSDANSSNTIIPMHRQDEIIEEACEIFADLPVSEQNQMRLLNDQNMENETTHVKEPEWKRKARIQAERREAEWQIQQNIQKNQDKLQTILKEKQNIIPEHEIPLTTIKSIRVVDNDVSPPEQPPKESVPIVHVKTTTCYCIIQ